MEALLYRPPGAGPFPLAIIAHSSSQSAETRARFTPEPYEPVAGVFVLLGYAVVVAQRPGYGRDESPFLEDQGGCEDANFTRASDATAQSLNAVLAAMAAQPFARRGDAVAVGFSGGGLGALALAARNPPGLRGVINVSGGLGGHAYDRAYNNCAPDRLVETSRTFGAKARAPTLWLYAENDTYFPPDLSGPMAQAYRAAGGKAEYRLLPGSGAEGHMMFFSPERWRGVAERFLATLR